MASSHFKVAVIGAGVSGLAAARHLNEYGLDVVVYERSSQPGGVWAYDERKPLEPKYPSILPSVADTSFDLDFDADLDSDSDGSVHSVSSPDSESKELPKDEKVERGNVEWIELNHAPPGPAYDGLTTNISTKLQTMKGHPWKEGIGDFVNVRVVGEYLADYASKFHVQDLVRYNTRVKSAEKVNGKWSVKSRQLIRGGRGGYHFVDREEIFDKLVAATGHYHACKVPDIAGLKEWKDKWPDRVLHSKAYRKPEEFQGQTLLLIGASTSSTDIAKELNGVAKKIYQSSRGGLYDLPATFLPPNTTRIGECRSFNFNSEDEDRGVIHLKDGTELTGIDKVIICTGYHITYPYLRHYHNDLIKPGDADDKILVTNGTQIHNLHKDIFYMPDPTLAFVGTAYHTATLSFFEFQAIAVAAVFSGKARLPSQKQMREEYRLKVKNKGLGRPFHTLMNTEDEYVEELVAWINAEAEISGGPKMEGHSAEWLEENEAKMEKLRKRFQQSILQ